MTLCFGMKVTIKEDSSNLPISFELLKCYLRINHNNHDTLLKEMISMAAATIENETENVLLERTLEVEHNNTHIFLPYKPVQKISEVYFNRKKLQADEYTVKISGNQHHVSFVQKPFTRSPRSKCLKVLYTVGHGSEAKDVPPALREAILREVSFLYHNIMDSSRKNKKSMGSNPWKYSQSFSVS